VSEINLDALIDDILHDVGAIKPLPEMKPYSEWRDIVAWIQDYFYLYDVGELIKLEPPQVAPLREAVRRNADGTFVYSRVIWSWIKKSAKSSIMAAVVDYFCYHKPGSYWRLVANDLKQADSRVGLYLRKSISWGAKIGYGDNDPTGEMRQFRADTKVRPSGYQIKYPNGSQIDIVPIDPEGEAGGNDDGIVISELWGWKTKSHQLAWTEMTISPNRFGYAQQWIDTYAGFEGESPVLEPLYRSVVSEENQVKLPHNDECYAHNGVFATWVTKPLLSWQTKAYYDVEEAALDPMQFRRMHRNAWGTSVDKFVEREWWESCYLPYEQIPPMDKYDLIQMALDAAVDSDCFGIIAVSRPPIRWQIAHGYAESDEVFIVRYARKWTPPRNAKLLFSGDDSPETELDRLTSTYNVQQVAYDPYQLEHFVSEQIEKGYSWYEQFNQGADRLKSDKFLYDTIKQKRLIHDGNPHLTEHIMNANREVSGGGKTGLRIIKRNDDLKIDLAVALSMALYRAKDTTLK
jgi:hypothetical protein